MLKVKYTIIYWHHNIESSLHITHALIQSLAYFMYSLKHCFSFKFKFVDEKSSQAQRNHTKLTVRLKA